LSLQSRHFERRVAELSPFAEEMKLAAVILLAAALPMSIFAKDTKEQAFWKWFEKNQDELYHFEKDLVRRNHLYLPGEFAKGMAWHRASSG
jgi:hypothetical protein